MSGLEGSLNGLKADPSARADYQNCRHGRTREPAWLTGHVRCRQAHRKWADGFLKCGSGQAANQIAM
jgi:hypothetical protein